MLAVNVILYFKNNVYCSTLLLTFFEIIKFQFISINIRVPYLVSAALIVYNIVSLI